MKRLLLAILFGDENSQPQKAGMKCPQCGTFIEIPVFELLTSSVLVCPLCHLHLNIDRMKSKPAFDALRKVHATQKDIEKKSYCNK